MGLSRGNRRTRAGTSVADPRGYRGDPMPVPSPVRSSWPPAGAAVAILVGVLAGSLRVQQPEGPRSADATVGSAAAPHWAFAPPRRPDLPPGSRPHPVDRFVAARLAAAGLEPSPRADRRTLLRRAALDLTGLPPEPEAMARYLADDEPGAWERAVDRLLASPHYGEHLAAQWLDLARYADTNGYEKDARRPGIWRWRDQIIQAFQRDQPFDEFTLEQIAGDLLPDPTPDQILATAFHRNTMTNDEGGTDDEEFRVAAVVDRVNTTMQVWMGLTVSCAQCHDHKYDPVSQREYFGIYACFNNTADADRADEAPTRRFPTAEQRAERTELMAEIAALQGAPAAEDPEELAALRARLDQLAGPAVPVMVELEGDARRPTHVHRRGSFLDPGEKVSPGVPAVLHPWPADAPRDRLGFARWLVAPENPLTARVIANRVWGRLFGQGLVATPEDFGLRGALPTHPALLDWLATELVRDGWSLRRFHRLLVTSETYRQASDHRHAAHAVDPENRLLWRAARFRLSAEQIRDQALAVSGLLDRTILGPSVMPPQPDGVWQMVYSNDRWETARGPGRHRRALYTFWRRTSPHPAMEAFDAPSREFCVVRRLRSSTPLQALVTLNDPAFVEMAQALARRMMAAADDPEARVEMGFERVLFRSPSTAERDRVLELWQRAKDRFARDPDGARAFASDPLGPLPAEADVVDAAAWTAVANVLLNLDEFLVRS